MTINPSPVRATIDAPSLRVFSSCLVTPEDLVHYMDIEFSNIQTEAAQMILEGIHDEMAAYLNRPIVVAHETRETHSIPHDAFGVSPIPIFSQGMGDDVTEWGQSYPYSQYYTLGLNNTPIVDVFSVTRRAAFSGATIETLTENADYVIREFGLDLYRVSPDDLITVDYRGGLDGRAIRVLRGIILRAAAREMQNMHDDVMSIKDLTARDVALKETGFLESEFNTLKRYRRVRA